VLVAEQRERPGLARPVAAGAAVEDNRRDVFGEGHHVRGRRYGPAVTRRGQAQAADDGGYQKRAHHGSISLVPGPRPRAALSDKPARRREVSAGSRRRFGGNTRRGGVGFRSVRERGFRTGERGALAP